MILKIDKDTKYCSVVTLCNDISEEEYLERYCDESYIKIDNDKVPNSRFLKILDSGEVIEDKERINQILFFQTKSKCLDILKKTDFILLSDNPLELSENDLLIVKEFRKKIRNINIDNFKDFPEIPVLLKKYIGE